MAGLRSAWVWAMTCGTICGAAALSPIGAARAATAEQIHLVPAPRETRFAGETQLPERIAVEVPGRNAEDEFAARDLEQAAKEIAPAPKGEHGRPYRITLLRTDSREARELLSRHGLTFDVAMEAEGYVLVIEPREAYVIGTSGAGVFYGVQTMKQLLPLPAASRVLPTGTVRDWPAMRYRGIDDDLSRGPFPTLKFQEHQIRVLASVKINVYSPYFEHTLLYPDQPLAAPPGSRLTPEEAKELVEYARQYHVTIVPEQEAFGHLHHVLKYDLYDKVAETLHGFVLAPGQVGTIPLIKDWFSQMAKEFPSPFIHIGADETFDLGIGRTREQVEKQGYGPVYVAFLRQIHDVLAPLHRKLLFWGDIGDENPGAIPGLPKDMIAVPWNYSANTDFDKLIEPFAKAGMETWVAPGVSNWNEVYPVEMNALLNIQRFISAGQRLGSTGALTTVWNDDGEGLFNMDWYGVLFGAAAAWQPGESPLAAYQNAYGAVFHHDASGKIDQAEKELTAAQELLKNAKTGMNSDGLFWVDPWSAEGQEAEAKLLPVAKELRLHAEQSIVLMEGAKRAYPGLLEPEALEAMDLGARRLDLIGMKFEFAREIEDKYEKAVAQQHDNSQVKQTRNMLDEVSGGNGRCQDLRDAYSVLKDEYSKVWLGENRPFWLGSVTVRYDLAAERWERRGERFLTAIHGWEHGVDLPPGSALGLPGSHQTKTGGQ